MGLVLVLCSSRCLFLPLVWFLLIFGVRRGIVLRKCVSISMYPFSASLYMDFIWLCLVSARCIINMGLVWVFIMWCRPRIVLCMPLVLNVTTLMDGCLYGTLSCVSCCVFVRWFVCELSVSCCVRFKWVRVQVFVLFLVFIVCMWSCSLVSCGGV